MLKIGVTGGIGSGKSLICRVFSVLGVPVYNADYEARRLMEEDRQVVQKLINSFGPGIFNKGQLDRKALAGIVFSNPDALNLLNSIVHPAVRTDFSSWAEKNSNASYVVKEAAILFETGMHNGLDSVILVTAPGYLRLHRVMRRDGETMESIKKRMANQWPDKKKEKLAGLVIKNDNTQLILPVILQLHSEFSSGHLPEVIETCR